MAIVADETAIRLNQAASNITLTISIQVLLGYGTILRQESSIPQRYTQTTQP